MNSLNVETLKELKRQELAKIDAQYWRWTRTTSSKIKPPDHSKLVEINKQLKDLGA